MRTHTVVDLFGLPFDAVTRDFMVSRVEDAIVRRSPIWLTFVNVAILVRVQKDEEARKVLETADYRLCDGMGLIYASRILGNPLPEMVSGPFSLFRLLHLAENKGYSVYFIGGNTEVIEKAVANVCCMYRTLKVAGYRDGFFPSAEEDEIVRQIRDSRAQLLFVGMGFPRERIFLSRNLLNLNVPVCMDIGGALTVLAGIHKIAPHWIRVAGMEWLYRMAQEPGRLWRRYLVTNSIFALMLIGEMLSKASRESKGVNTIQLL
jgi:N-acetylglucosaminyldiphosphoundecaprenol N-acetyl-beta-D-mannosaminyltransferase